MRGERAWMNLKGTRGDNAPGASAVAPRLPHLTAAKEVTRLACTDGCPLALAFAPCFALPPLLTSLESGSAHGEEVGIMIRKLFYG